MQQDTVMSEKLISFNTVFRAVLELQKIVQGILYTIYYIGTLIFTNLIAVKIEIPLKQI